MFSFFKKSPEEISRVNPGFEETERKTPKAGSLLLIIMTIAGLFFGWRALDDLSGLVGEPKPLSSCSYRYQSAYLSGTELRPHEPAPLYDEKGYSPYYYDGNDSSECQFNDIEKAHGIPDLFLKRKPLDDQIRTLQTSLNSVSASLSSVRSQIDQLLRQYGLGLQEKGVNITNPLFPPGPAQQNYLALKNQESQLVAEQADLQSKFKGLQDQVKASDNELTEAYKPVLREQNTALRWYEFKVFLFQMLFVLPFFWLVFSWYLRLHRKNSPYTVILLGIVAVAGILLLRVILFWFWDLFLYQVIQTVLRWFAQYQIVRTLIFYGGMVLSFAVFGGAVYFLQKKVFDPRRVAIRRFRAKQCPNCQTNLDLSVFYCPNCGHQLKEKCEKCGQPRFVELPVCPYCGDKK